LNNEFLKGIQARERIEILKQLRIQDQQIISYYRDSIIPLKNLEIESLQKNAVILSNTAYVSHRRMKRWQTISAILTGVILYLL
jgi:hypothetical protein